MRRAVAAVALTVALLFAAPAFAGYDGGIAGIPSIQAGAKIAGDLDFELEASGKRGPDQVELTVSKQSRTAFRVNSYTPIATSSPTDGRTVRQRLGKHGSIAMHFRVEERSGVNIPGSCRRIVFASGVLAGRLRFHAERRFIDIERQRLPAESARLVKRDHCRATEARGTIAPTLVSCRKDGALLTAEKDRASRSSLFSAFGIDRDLGGVKALSVAFAVAEGSALKMSPELDHADVDPPLPFYGSAVFDDQHLRGDISLKPLGGARSIALTPASAKIFTSGGNIRCGNGGEGVARTLDRVLPPGPGAGTAFRSWLRSAAP